MSNGLIIQGALANVSERISDAEVDKILSSHPCLVPFRLAPPPIGEVQAATFDWALILSVTADIAEVAGVFWLLYQRFIKTEQKEKKNSSFLLIQIKHPNGRSKQLTISVGTESKDEFEKEFERAAKELLDGQTNVNAIALADQYEKSGHWVKVKRYDF